jgi:hypothetical protein
MITKNKPYKLLRDGEVISEFASYWDIYKYIHQNHSYSLDHALTWEGYEIQSNLDKGESNE